MNRAAIYARFSSDRQNDRSNDDQIALVKDYCARQGWQVAAIYQDHALSGASIVGRADMQRLIADAAARRFDIVVADSLSRIGRDEEDRAGIRKRLAFHDVQIATPVDGIVTRLVDGIRAVMDGNYLEDLKHATRRGMAGNIRDGLSAGGQAYGYRAVPGAPGKRTIEPAEAAIIAEIFARYIAGDRARTIAADLNRRGIAPPRGRQWAASTINGSRQRSTGILENELYAGRIVWNKVRMVKDPDTGKRISRPNAEADWQCKDAPDLAIIDRATFDKAQSIKRSRSDYPAHAARQPKRILSGLLRCAACGGGLSIKGRDHDGATRVRCSSRAEGRACPSPHSFKLEAIEAQTLRALRTEFERPDVIAEYVREYHAERKRLAGDSSKRRGEIERRLGEIERALARATDALLNGIGDRIEIDARCKALRAEHTGLSAELAALPETHQVVTLHPAAIEQYRRQVASLETRLSQVIIAGDQEAISAIRDLVESVAVAPGARPGTVSIEIAGRLSRLIGTAVYPSVKLSGGSMVAGGRILQSPRPNSGLFRLRAAG